MKKHKEIVLLDCQNSSKATKAQSKAVKLMTKGLSWTVEEETHLKKLIQAKTPIDVVAATLGRTAQAILVKCQRLGIVATDHVTTSTLPLPAELPSVEETLKKLAGALEAASAPGLSKVEVERLQVMATLARAYKEILIDYLNIREVEAKLNDMEAKYATLLEGINKNSVSQPASASTSNNGNIPTQQKSEPNATTNVTA